VGISSNPIAKLTVLYRITPGNSHYRREIAAIEAELIAGNPDWRGGSGCFMPALRLGPW